MSRTRSPSTPASVPKQRSAHAEGDVLEYRTLILAPDGADGSHTKDILDSAGLVGLICPDVEGLVQEAEVAAGALLVTEEAIEGEARRVLSDLLASQPSWSDLPILVLTRQGTATSLDADEAAKHFGNVTLLERPVPVATVVSTLRAALRARERQYEVRGRMQIQSLLAAIVESSDDAIISKTLEGIIVSWNAGAEALFGYTAEEAVGQSITLLIPPERLDEERDILARLRRGERIAHYETVRVTKSGKPLQISLTTSPVRDAANRVVGASKVARDITHRREAEQALRDADRRKDEFLATLSHELRNPLAPIRNSLHILRMAGSLDPAVVQARAILERQVGHLVRLVDDLLEISRITRGKTELRRERIELAAVIGSAVETSRPLIDTAGHDLVLSIPTKDLSVDADPVRLSQVFANLLNNAAKYSEPGGTIWLSARREDAQVVVSVRDAGIGIAHDMLPRVFEMFAQEAGAMSRAQGGLGIGLTLVQNLVQMHGGSVEAHSAGRGKGSEFIVRLPLLTTEAEAAHDQRPALGNADRTRMPTPHASA